MPGTLLRMNGAQKVFDQVGVGISSSEAVII